MSTSTTAASRASRERAIALLRSHEEEIRARGAISLYLFGSVRRGEGRSESDVDLFMDYDRARKFSLIDQVGLKIYLEELLERPVDLLTRNAIHRRMRSRIEAETERVF